MAKKKSRPTGQFSLLELIPDCIEGLRQENEKEEAYTRSMLLGNQPITTTENDNEHREQLGGRTDSHKSDGQRSFQAFRRNGIVRNNDSFKNSGQMGVEQPGEIEGNGKALEQRGIIRQIRRTSGTGIGSEGNREVLGFDRQRFESLGSVENDGDRNGTVKNYVITDSDNIGVGTPKQKFRDNINALNVLYSLRKNNATAATKEEQALLVKYVGWGGLPQVFDEQNKDWQNEHNELKALLTEKDYENARRSTQDAHFTPKNIIDTMYQGLKQFGIKDNVKILEPAAGIGNFIGFKPQDFSVYDDLKKKLIVKGIPEKEIAFIHDAKTDLKKKQLFSDVSNGKIRVLIGSTSKMGSGMNVQERLVAAHHLDAPWRPSDLEQRNGRIIRQGNELYKKDPDNFKIQIYNYATKQTYDARMWQTIEYKAAAIEQFRKGDVLQRSIEDFQSESANAAEMKAAASGNPLILLEVSYKAEVKKLEAQYNQFLKRQHSLEDRIHYLEKADERIEALTQKYDNACMLRDKNKIEKPEIMIDGKKVTSENAQVLAAAIKDGIKETQMLFTAKPKIGVYRGFDIFMQNAPRNGDKGFKFVLSMPNGGEYSPQNLAYTEKDDLSLSGFFTRLDNFMSKGIDEEFQKEKSFYENEKKELANMKSLRGAVFEQADELEVAKHNHNAVLKELNYMRDCKDYVPKFKPLTVEEHRANKAKEQTLLQPKNSMIMTR